MLHTCNLTHARMHDTWTHAGWKITGEPLQMGRVPVTFITYVRQPETSFGNLQPFKVNYIRTYKLLTIIQLLHGDSYIIYSSESSSESDLIPEDVTYYNI